MPGGAILSVSPRGGIESTPYGGGGGGGETPYEGGGGETPYEMEREGEGKKTEGYSTP